MADGYYVHDGALAADPRYYTIGHKFGSLIKLKIGKKWKLFRAEDTGGAIKGPGRFDIWMASCKDAINFGVQKLQYRVQE